MTAAMAYDAARKEFYAARLAQDVERRVAKEEAESTGAYFGKSALEVGMELEDKAYEQFKAWAIKEDEALTLRRTAVFTGVASALDETRLLVEAEEENEEQKKGNAGAAEAAEGVVAAL